MYETNLNESYYNFTKRKRVLQKFIDWIQDEIQDEAKLLDAGCGYGFLLKICENLGWDIYGIDVSRHAIKMAQQSVQASLLCQDISETSFPNTFFDVIILFDVIEHVKSPYRTLEEVQRILKKGGIVAIHTPNANAIGRHITTILHREWFGEDPTHMFLFTPYTLKFLLTRFSFKVRKVKTPFKPFPQPLTLGRSGLGGAIWLMAIKI